MLSNLLVLAIILFFGTAFAYFVFISAREWSTLNYLTHYGELADARITNLSIDNSGRGSMYFVEYRYFDGGMYHNGKQQISKKHYQQFQQQDYVTVRFAQTQRHWSRLGKSDFDATCRNDMSLIAIIGCFLFLPFTLLWVISYFGTNWYLVGKPFPKKKKRSDI